MYKKIILVLVSALVIGGAGWYLFVYEKQKEAAQVSNFAPVQPSVVETKPTIEPIVPAKNLDELEARLADKNVLDLYVARSDKGAFAAQVLSDFRGKKNLVVKEDAHRMYIEGGLKANDESNPAIVLVNCAEVMVKPFMDEEYSPGYITLTLYTTNPDLSKANQIYLSPDQDESEFGSKWPILYGPYMISAAEAKSSFADLDCIKL